MGLIERIRNWWDALILVRTQKDVLEQVGRIASMMTLKWGADNALDMLDVWCVEWQKGNRRLPLAEYLDRKIEAHDDIVWMARHKGL